MLANASAFYPYTSVPPVLLRLSCEVRVRALVLLAQGAVLRPVKSREERNKDRTNKPNKKSNM